MSITYQLQRIGKRWKCHVRGYKLVAYGKRPDLAIRYWLNLFNNTLGDKTALGYKVGPRG